MTVPDVDVVKAIANDKVCSFFIAQKLEVSRQTCGEHLKVLAQAGLVRGKKIRHWVFDQRDEEWIAKVRSC